MLIGGVQPLIAGRHNALLAWPTCGPFFACREALCMPSCCAAPAPCSIITLSVPRRLQGDTLSKKRTHAKQDRVPQISYLWSAISCLGLYYVNSRCSLMQHPRKLYPRPPKFAHPDPPPDVCMLSVVLVCRMLFGMALWMLLFDAVCHVVVLWHIGVSEGIA